LASSSSAAALAAASGSDPPTIDLGSAAAVSELADDSVSVAVEAGRCRLTLSKPVLKAPVVSALETTMC